MKVEKIVELLNEIANENFEKFCVALLMLEKNVSEETAKNVYDYFMEGDYQGILYLGKAFDDFIEKE